MDALVCASGGLMHCIGTLNPPGIGKTSLACALAHAACRPGHTVRYHPTAWLLHQAAPAHAAGSYPRLLDALARLQRLVLHDCLRDPLTRPQAQDLLDIRDDRYDRASALVVSQVPA